MEKKNMNLGDVAADVGKAAADFFRKASDAVVTAVDQNGDGKLDFDDVAVVTDSVMAAIKENSARWNQRQEQLRREKELKMLRPIFECDVEEPDFSLPKLLRVAEMDERHAASDVCKGSIGYIFSGKDLDVITIYPTKIGDFGLRFYPDMDSEMYYVDPAVSNHYIALDNYFNYLKIARIGELQKIAQDLGAKHFRVTYKEHLKSIISKDAAGNAKIPGNIGGSVDGEHHSREDNFSKIEIAAEMEFLGHKPAEPSLVYFRKDPQIRSLVSLRMADNAMTHQVYMLDLSNSSGLRVKDAIKIDAALSAMKISGNAAVTHEAQTEMRRVFEYEIDF